MILEFFSNLVSSKKAFKHEISQVLQEAETPKQSLPLEITSTPFFAARDKNQDNYIESSTQKSGNESWTFFSSGDYSHGDEIIAKNDVKEYETLLPPRNGIELKGNEITIALLIVDSLQKKKEIKVVDVGGMWGYSWLRLALYFKELVRNNQLTFIITNLRYSPNELIEKVENELKAPSLLDEKTREYYQVIVDGSRLVHYVQCSTRSLQETVGSCDILFESHSATYHSTTPGRERLSLVSALNLDGMYISEIGLHRLKEDRYKEINNLIGLNSKATEEEIKSAREAELDAANTLISNNPNFTVVRELEISQLKAKVTPHFFIVKKRSAP